MGVSSEACTQLEAKNGVENDEQLAAGRYDDEVVEHHQSCGCPNEVESHSLLVVAAFAGLQRHQYEDNNDEQRLEKFFFFFVEKGMIFFYFGRGWITGEVL